MQRVTLSTAKTFATEAGAVKAAETKFGHTDLRYFIQPVGERFMPVFVGEPAVQAGAHFHFNVIG